VRKQAEHRVRKAASLARPGWIWAAALVMNAPSVAATAVCGWFAFTADGAALTAVAGIIFALALLWVSAITTESWHVLRRFARLSCRTRTV
jgi:hypothetical protein